MIECHECGSTDVYFEYGFEVWQNSDGEFELDNEQIEYVTKGIDNSEERYICNECGNIFTPIREGSKYKIFISKIEYGSIEIVADSEENAIEQAHEMAKLHSPEIHWHDVEISDVSVDKN